MSNGPDSKKLFDSGDAVEDVVEDAVEDAVGDAVEELSIVSARVAKDDGGFVSERSFSVEGSV